LRRVSAKVLAADLLEGDALVVALVRRIVAVVGEDLVHDLAHLVLVVGVGEDVGAVLADPVEDARADHVGLHAVFVDPGEPLDRRRVDRLHRALEVSGRTSSLA
jgi:hypothetical protein